MKTISPRILFATLATGGLLIAAQAQAASAPGLYVGANTGISLANHHTAGLDGAVANQGVNVTSGNSDKQDTAWGLTLGYDINPNLAVEAGYVNLGSMGYQSNATGGAVTGSLKSQGLTLAAKGSLPLANGFTAYGKVGLIDARTDLRTSGLSTTNTREYSVEPLVGLGVSYDITPKVATNVEWTHYSDLGGASTSEASYNTLSVGLRYKF